MQRGENVVLSTSTEVAIATGCVVEAGYSHVTFATDRDVSNWDRNCDVSFRFSCVYREYQEYMFAGFALGQTRIPRRAIFALFKP